MSRSIRSLALAAALVAAGCKESASGPIAACQPVGHTCASNAECCSYGCLSAFAGQPGQCFANPVEGGWCRTTSDCSGLTCKSDHCTAAAVCRDDGDVCSLDGQCCTGNCTTDAICVRGNSAPVAIISSGPSGTSVNHGRLVTWRGDTSYDPDVQLIQGWQWTVTERPAGSTAQLTGATSSIAGLVPDRDGPWTIQLVVSDGIATSTPVTVSFQSVNAVPTANVTLQPTVAKGVVVTLHGEGSGDANGDPITFAWTVTVGGAPVALDLTNPAQPKFTASVADVYSVQLVVTDSFSASSAPVATTIASTNYAPVANAGAAQVLNLGKAGGPVVTLDGTHSTDQNPGDPKYYTWTLTSRPDGSAATLSNTSDATPTFTPDLVGTYGATLSVNDGVLTSQLASSVTVTVLPHLWKLGYAVVDAEYSKAPLDKIVAISTTGTTGMLHVIDPVAETEQTLALPKPPKCVGLSPDGTQAVIGYDALLTYVDLTSGTPVRIVADLPVPLDVGDCLLGPQFTVSTKTHRYAYLLPAYNATAYSLDLLVAGANPAAFPSSVSAGMHGVLEPAAGAVWTEDYGSSLEKFTVTTGPATTWNSYSYTDVSGHPAISEHPAPNTRIYGMNGKAVTLVISPTTYKPTYAGALSPTGGNLFLQHASHRLSGATDLLAVIPVDDTYTTPVEDGEVRVFDGSTLAENTSLRHPLPLWGSGTTVSYKTHGKFVLQRSDATARYVILAADAAASDSASHAIAVFAP